MLCCECDTVCSCVSLKETILYACKKKSMGVSVCLCVCVSRDNIFGYVRAVPSGDGSARNSVSAVL